MSFKIKNNLFLLTLLFPVLAFPVNFDNYSSVNLDINIVKNDSLLLDSIYTKKVDGSFVDKLDYYYKSWYLDSYNKKLLQDTSELEMGPIVICSDSTYLSRLDSLYSAVPLSYNEIVKSYIELYTTKRRMQVAGMLGASKFFFPIFEEELDANCMPLELKYLPVIESALNPKARSRAGACGLWQFMYATGRMYHLEINSFVDQRMDPVISTKAAVRYLKDLYSMYDDWILVIAAYNCGPGNVNKAIRRTGGGKKTYWDIYYHLPRETRGYVPAFIAAMYTFNYYKEHGIPESRSVIPPMCDTIVLSESVNFEQISKVMDVSIDELSDLNPEYKLNIIPAGYGHSYSLKLPYDYVNNFIDNQDTIFAYNRSKYFNDKIRTADPRNRIKFISSSAGNKVRYVYRVRRGDVPGTISRRFNVSLTNLRYWNNLNRHMTIRLNQKLVLYISQNLALKYRKYGNYTRVSNSRSAPNAATTADGSVIYIVKSGESLWTIARKYPGISADNIKQWNRLGHSAKIKPGQRLKIKI